MIRYLLLLFPFLLCAEVTEAYRGQKLSSLETSGFVRLIECEVTGLTQIKGTLETSDCVLNRTVVNGTTFLKGTSVFKKSEFKGPFTARGSVFLAPIYITAKIAEIAKSKTRDITVSAPTQGVIYLHLVDTLVLGDITFYQGKGVVTLDRGSSVRGKIKGGRMIKHGSSKLN